MAESMSNERLAKCYREAVPWYQMPPGMEREIAKYDQCEEPDDCDHDHDNAIEYFREQELNGLRERAEKAEVRADEQAKAHDRWVSYSGDLENRLAEARNALTVAAELIDRLTDDSTCDYDHHDNCRTHSLQRRSCPYPLGRQFVTAWRAVEVEQKVADDA